MCKKLIVVCLVLGLASAAYATYGTIPNTLISDFETGTTEGWTNAYGLYGGYKSGYPAWATDGDTWTAGENQLIGVPTGGSAGSGVQDHSGPPDLYSLKVQATEGWWNEAAVIDLVPLDLADDFKEKEAVEVQIDFRAAEWALSSGAWARPNLTLAVCAETSDPKYDIDSVAYPGRGWWFVDWDSSLSWWNGRGDSTELATLYYAASGIRGKIADDPDYLAIILIPHWVENFQWTTAGGIYYLDSVALVPEPATMALLGLGGLALIRRKR